MSEAKRDFHWLLTVAPKNPGKVYRGSDRYDYRWDCGLEYRVRGEEEWHDMHVLGDTLSATFAAEPEAGSGEAVAASAEGACWWWDTDRTEYHKRLGIYLLAIDTLTGKQCNQILMSDFRRDGEADGWLPILDSNGQPAEPVVGSRLWAEVVTRDLGQKVTHHRMQTLHSGEYEYYNRTHSCFMRHMRDGVDYTTTFMQITKGEEFDTGWSLYVEPPAPSPILSSLKAAREAIGRAIAAAGGAE